ncbi:MAG: hypothetical protein V5A59_08305 [Bacteroidales bacterium]
MNKNCIRLSFLLIILFSFSISHTQEPWIKQTDRKVILQNDQVGFQFDLSRGTYRIVDKQFGIVPVKNAKLQINQWSSDDKDFNRSWDQHDVKDELGKGLALDLKFKADNRPDLLFTFILYENQNFISATAGITNTTNEITRVKDIYMMADGAMYYGTDMTEEFAMVDGFSGGEPLEYGRRVYSPLTRSNALKSRNNILITFTEDQDRRSLVMGGLTYHDFEKFATIKQARRDELELGKDNKSSLLCYLDLPGNKPDKSKNGEILELTEGKELRTWSNHEFRCKETATSVRAHEEIVIEARNLKEDKIYTLGFSWWRGFRHGNHGDHRQSVFVEYVEGGSIKRLPLLENKLLPRFDRAKKQDPEQMELPLPPTAVSAGKLRIVVEKSPQKTKDTEKGSNQHVSGDKHAYLNEIWLRDGGAEALLPDELTPLSESPRPRQKYTGQLFARDPIGKRVDPNDTYQAPDRFYISFTTPDPFIALENYGSHVQTAQKFNLSMYDFPTVCLWYAANDIYGDSEAENTSLGAVEEMERIAESGFLKYSRAAVRLVPDSYMPNNQQGWWDNKHWQQDVEPHNGSKNGQYIEPYETTEKWGQAVTELGGIPLSYNQTGFRSEDYAKAFPGHMLFNKTYAWKGQPADTSSELFTDWRKTWARNGRLWSYDYTDPDFIDHMQNVYKNLKKGGVKGWMFDYPASGWASGGGMEDDYSTTAAAYRNIFQLPTEGLAPEAYVHERNMERGTDISIGLVASMRTENDTELMDKTTVTRCGLRWYKNRVLMNLDTDSKDIASFQDNRDHVRAILTMAYVTTGRLLLANSFSQFSGETLWDISRTFPYHTTHKSARPVNAFVSEFPSVYDFKVNDQWHQVTFYNPDLDSYKAVSIDISGNPVEGALNLNKDKTYYVYDFWNDRFVGKIEGNSHLKQVLRPAEARMMSVRECLERPQVLSTNRHVMQGYLDMVRVEWNENRSKLTGVSKIVGQDPYEITLALNGYHAGELTCKDRKTKATLSSGKDGMVRLTLERPENGTVEWSVTFDRP